MKEKSRRRIKRDQAQRDPRARLTSSKTEPPGKPGQAGTSPLVLDDDELEGEEGTGELEHEETRRIVGYDE